MTSDADAERPDALALGQDVDTLEALLRDDRYDDTLPQAKRIVDRHRDATDPAVRQQVVRALGVQAWALDALEREEEADEAFDEILEFITDETDPVVRREAVSQAYDRADGLQERGRDVQALGVIERFVNDLADDPPLESVDLVVDTMTLAAIVAHKLGDSEAALQLQTEAVQRFAGYRHPRVRWSIARIRINQVAVLGLTGRAREAVALADEIAESLTDNSDEDFAELRAEVLLRRAGWLAEYAAIQGVEGYRRITREYSSHDNEEVARIVSEARRGITMLTSSEDDVDRGADR